MNDGLTMSNYFDATFKWFEGKEYEKVDTCIICGTKHSSEDNRPMAITQCSKCGFIWNMNQPTNETLAMFYNQSKPMTMWANIKSDTNEEIRQEEKYKYIWSYLFHTQVGSVLDVGCGNGFFLNRVDSSIKRIGIEPNTEASMHCNYKVYPTYEEFIIHENNNGNVIDINSKEHNEQKFDVITMFGVLEHFKYPIAEIRKYAKLLSPTGKLITITPNVNSLIVKLLGNGCATFCPQHLWYYNATSLSNLAAKASLCLEHTYTIESELQPILRHLRGFKAYSNIGIQLTDKDITEQSIIENNLGYKLVCFFGHIPELIEGE